MQIDELNTMGAGITSTGIELDSMVRKGAIVLCESLTFPIEKVFVEFETETLAIDFEEAIKSNTAQLILDEDTSINAAPKELREEYELALAAGNKKQVEELLTELWEEYGIHGDTNQMPDRETSGIKRLAIMHDDGVNAFGFKGQTQQLFNWMSANGFPIEDHNLSLYD
jgi:3D (Asp-Asp-Asp) domain-containing protein